MHAQSTVQGFAYRKSLSAFCNAKVQQAPAVLRAARCGVGEGFTSSLGHRHLDELLIIDLAIAINVGLADHLIDLFISELLPEVGHHVPQLRSTDESIAIAVENLESFDELLLRVSVLHLTSHQRKELWEIDGSIAISVHLVDHVLQFGLSWVLPEGTHHCTQLLGGNGAITVLVEEGEGR